MRTSGRPFFFFFFGLFKKGISYPASNKQGYSLTAALEK